MDTQPSLAGAQAQAGLGNRDIRTKQRKKEKGENVGIMENGEKWKYNDNGE